MAILAESFREAARCVPAGWREDGGIRRHQQAGSERGSSNELAPNDLKRKRRGGAVVQSWSTRELAAKYDADKRFGRYQEFCAVVWAAIFLRAPTRYARHG